MLVEANWCVTAGSDHPKVRQALLWLLPLRSLPVLAFGSAFFERCRVNEDMRKRHEEAKPL